LRAVGGGLVGLVALALVGSAAGAAPESGLRIVVFGVCSAVGGILAAFSYRRVSPPFAISYVCSFVGGILVAGWIRHQFGEMYGNTPQPTFEPDMRLYAPVLVSFTITLFILEFRGSTGGRGASGRLSEPPPPSTLGGDGNSKRQVGPSARRSSRRRRRPPPGPGLGDPT